MSKYVWPGPGVVTVHAHPVSPPVVFTPGTIIDATNPGWPTALKVWVEANCRPAPQPETDDA